MIIFFLVVCICVHDSSYIKRQTLIGGGGGGGHTLSEFACFYLFIEA